MTGRKRIRATCGRLAIVLVVVLFLGIPAADAQIIYQDPARITQSAVYLHWNMTGETVDASVSEWVMPISGMVPVAANTELQYYTAVVGAQSSLPEIDQDLAGLTDTRLHLARSLAEDHLLVAGGVNLPSGQKELNPTEFALAQFIAEERFNFPLKVFGQGLGIYGEVLGAWAYEQWIFSGGGGLHYSGSYTPLDDDVSYQPGVRYYVTGSAQLTSAKRQSDYVRFDGVASIAAADQADDVDVFKDGTQIDVAALGARRFGQWHAQANVRLILRGKDKRLAEGGNLVVERNSSTGSEFRFRLQTGRPVYAGWQGSVDVSTKFLAANGYPEDDVLYDGGATLFGIGGTVAKKIRDQIHLQIGLRKWFGSAEKSGLTEALDLGGWELSERLTITF